MVQERTDLGNRVRTLYDTDPDRDVYETLALEVDGLYRLVVRHAHTAANTAISVYPVGFMSDLLAVRAKLAHGAPISWRWHAEQFRRQWRNRNYWNGFLAEVDYPPSGLIHTMCGRGWTRRRAARNLGYQLWLDNSNQRG